MTLDMANIFQDRFANQQVVLQCMAQENLDALVSPAGNIPAYILGAPIEPPLSGRTNSVWGLVGQHGIPTLSVPAGFTTRVFDRVRDGAAPGGTRLTGPIPAKLPIGVMFFGTAFFRADAISNRFGVRGGNKTPDSAAGLWTRSRTVRDSFFFARYRSGTDEAETSRTVRPLNV